MYQGKFENNTPKRRPRRGSKRLSTLVLSAILVVTLAVGGTIAYLVANDDPITNTFTPAHVSSEVTEEFNGTVKKNVNVTNTSDIPVYIRVKLVTYRVNDDGQHIGGAATIPDFKPGTGWVYKDGYYYYNQPVQPGAKPVADLINSITLKGSYDDADGGKQVIEVMAEAIQANGVTADGTKAVVTAWDVDPETLK